MGMLNSEKWYHIDLNINNKDKRNPIYPTYYWRSVLFPSWWYDKNENSIKEPRGNLHQEQQRTSNIERGWTKVRRGKYPLWGQLARVYRCLSKQRSNLRLSPQDSRKPNLKLNSSISEDIQKMYSKEWKWQRYHVSLQKQIIRVYFLTNTNK